MEIIIGAEYIDATTEERHGLINYLVPDDKLDDFVLQLAFRISQFDPIITGQAKTMINERSPKPSMDRIIASRTACVQANLRPERQSVSKKLQAWRILQDGDFERNLGNYLNHIDLLKNKKYKKQHHL